MGLQRRCPKPKGCGRAFVPRRGTRRVYCYVCKPEKVASGPESLGEAPPLAPDGALALAVKAELERTGEAGSVLGAVAVRLARELEGSQLTPPQVGSLSAQLMRIMEPLRSPAVVPQAADVVDEFTARLWEKQAAL